MNLRAVGTAHRRWPDRYVPYLRHGSSLTRGHVFRYVVPTGRFSSGFAYFHFCYGRIIGKPITFIFPTIAIVIGKITSGKCY